MSSLLIYLMRTICGTIFVNLIDVTLEGAIDIGMPDFWVLF